MVDKFMTKRIKSQGMTLIELMVVVAIVAILAGIAFPAYQQHVIKSNRVDAQTVLIEAAQYMERFYTANHRYDQDLAGNAVVLPADLTASPVGADTVYYNVAINAVGTSTYTLTATPQGTQVDDGRLDINNLGVKVWDKNNDAVTDPGESCWAKKCG